MQKLTADRAQRSALLVLLCQLFAMSNAQGKLKALPILFVGPTDLLFQLFLQIPSRVSDTETKQCTILCRTPQWPAAWRFSSMGPAWTSRPTSTLSSSCPQRKPTSNWPVPPRIVSNISPAIHLQLSAFGLVERSSCLLLGLRLKNKNILLTMKCFAVRIVDDNI